MQKTDIKAKTRSKEEIKKFIIERGMDYTKPELAKKLGLKNNHLEGYITCLHSAGKMDRNTFFKESSDKKRVVEVGKFIKRKGMLDKYEDFIKSKIEEYPNANAGHLREWITEKYGSFKASQMTVYRFSMYVRKKYNLKGKPETGGRKKLFKNGIKSIECFFENDLPRLEIKCTLKVIASAIGISTRSLNKYLTDDNWKTIDNFNHKLKKGIKVGNSFVIKNSKNIKISTPPNKKYNRKNKFSDYEDFIVSKLKLCPSATSTQIQDWVKEEYPEFKKLGQVAACRDILKLRKKYNLMDGRPMQGSHNKEACPEKLKLYKYEQFVREKIEKHPKVTSIEMFAFLKEFCSEINVSERTVYTFSLYVRKKYNLMDGVPKRGEHARKTKVLAINSSNTTPLVKINEPSKRNFDEYEGFVRTKLEHSPNIASFQIYKLLKERYADDEMNENNVCVFVEYVRKKYNICVKIEEAVPIPKETVEIVFEKMGKIPTTKEGIEKFILENGDQATNKEMAKILGLKVMKMAGIVAGLKRRGKLQNGFLLTERERKEKFCFKNEDGVCKNKARTDIIDAIKKSDTNLSKNSVENVIMSLPATECIMEKRIADEISTKYYFDLCEKDEEIFKDMYFVARELGLNIRQMYLGLIKDKIERAESDEFCHLILDYTQEFQTLQKEIRNAIHLNIVRVGGIIAITAANRGSGKENIISRLNDLTGGEKVSNGVEAALTLWCEENYRLEEFYPYKDKGRHPMIFAIIRRIK